MPPATDPARYKHQHLPGDLSGHGVWPSYRDPLSDRAVQARLFERGSPVSHAALRPWWRKVGQDDAHRRRRSQPGDPGYWDAVFLPLHGERHDLGRAGEQEDHVRDSRVPRRCKPCHDILSVSGYFRRLTAVGEPL